jgi:integrase
MPVISQTSVKEHRARVREDGTLADAYLWDDELTGFGCKATPGGKRAFFVQYRPRGGGQNIKRVHIGYYGKLTVAQARAEAKRLLGEANAGHDPREAEKKKQEAEKAAMAAKAQKAAKGTLKDVIERYLAAHETPKGAPSKYWRDRRARLLGREMKPVLSTPIGDVKRAAIMDVLDAVKERSPAVARALFADLRPAFRYAVERDLIQNDPMAGIKAPNPASARDRVLSADEIRAFWQAAGELSWPFENVFKVLLLTGQRREEVAGLCWRELDLDAGQWTIAKERCKNGKAHTVDLAPEAVRLLDRFGDAAAARRADDTEFVFSTTGRTPVSGFSKAKARLDARMREILGDKFREWRTHDLRRTAASGMAALGFQPHVIERVLNHVSGAQGGLVGVRHYGMGRACDGPCERGRTAVERRAPACGLNGRACAALNPE